MPKLGMFLVALLATCSIARALPASKSSSLVFWAAPLPVDTPAAPTAFAPATAGAESPPQESAVASASGGRAATPAARAETDAEVDRQLESLNEAVAQHGERARESLDPLLALAELYQQRGEPTLETAALEQAIHILRVNSGLYALDQADAVESLMTSREAAGQHAAAATLGDYLQELVTRNPDDPRVAGILTGLADAEMDAARRLLNTPPPLDFHVTMEASAGWAPAPPTIQSPAAKTVMDARRHYELGLGAGYARAQPTVKNPALKALLDARGHYEEAIEAGRRDGSVSGAELLALQDRLVDTLYFELWHRPQLSYYEEPELRVRAVFSDAVIEALTAKVDYSESFGGASVDVAKARIELGDWYLMFRNTATALDQYEQAYESLQKDGVPPDTIRAIVSPPIPARLPAVAGPGADSARTPRGYVDAAVTTRFGTVTDVDILAASPGTANAIEKHLRQYISRSHFRPRFVDGQPARSDRFTARFYYAY
jgi:hypothetical protein